MNSTIISSTVAAMMALFGMGPHVPPMQVPAALVWTQDARVAVPGVIENVVSRQ